MRIKYVKRANMWVVNWQEWKNDKQFTIQKWFNTEEEAKQFVKDNETKINN